MWKRETRQRRTISQPPSHELLWKPQLHLIPSIACINFLKVMPDWREELWLSANKPPNQSPASPTVQWGPRRTQPKAAKHTPRHQSPSPAKLALVQIPIPRAGIFCERLSQVQVSAHRPYRGGNSGSSWASLFKVADTHPSGILGCRDQRESRRSGRPAALFCEWKSNKVIVEEAEWLDQGHMGS